ncbi:hypothetical protein ACFVXC_18380 [Streptomyces sp. NPDC058257]|uniref:hypothetical protein n=1 Tax=Streptomyces sp. NPDC058257 TaxID=3346409 RepID=UPI0036E50099
MRSAECGVAGSTHFDFYGFWDELLGRVSTAPARVTDAGGGPRVYAAREGPVQPAGPQSPDQVHGLPVGPFAKVGSVQSVRIIGRRTRHPAVYTSAAALSADYKVTDDLTTGSLVSAGPREPHRQRGHDLVWRLRHLPIPRVSVLVASSRQGEPDYGPTVRFLKAIRPPMTSARIILPRGSHHFTTWRREIGPAMERLGGQLTFPQDTTPSPTPRHVTRSATQ